MTAAKKELSASARGSSEPFERRHRVVPRRNDRGRKEALYPVGATRSSFQDVARNEAGPPVRPGEAWHIVSGSSRRLRFNGDAKQMLENILAGVVREIEFFACMPYLPAHVSDWSVQMAHPTDLGGAQRYRIEVSMTRSESVAIVVEEPLDDLARYTPSGRGSPAASGPPAASTDSGLRRLPMPRSFESPRKLLEGRRK